MTWWLRTIPIKGSATSLPSGKMKNVTEQVSRKGMKDFLEEAEKEKQELNESYKESVRQANERKE